MSGLPWTSQLQLAAKQSKRACQRGRGPAKRAQPLPLDEVADLQNTPEAMCEGGPSFPIRSTIISSWWLLREIEASSAMIKHITLDHDKKLARWHLPSSKADWKALGATRTHACHCNTGGEATLCPFHLVQAQVQHQAERNIQTVFSATGGVPTSKVGWASTFEFIATLLGKDTTGPTGLKLFTGHSARASGAIHLARSHVELWKIQLFGRWGSEVFKVYLRESPLVTSFKYKILPKKPASRHHCKLHVQNFQPSLHKPRMPLHQQMGQSKNNPFKSWRIARLSLHWPRSQTSQRPKTFT